MSYYTRIAAFVVRTLARGSDVRNELDGVQTGFETLPLPHSAAPATKGFGEDVSVEGTVTGSQATVGTHFPTWAQVQAEIAAQVAALTQSSSLAIYATDNMVINGNMVVRQQPQPFTALGAGTGLSYLTLDRWKLETYIGTVIGVVDVTQDTDTPAALDQERFGYSLKVDVTTVETNPVAAGGLFFVTQHIEAQNLQHFRSGTTVGQFAVSFYMKSPKTGTHCVAFRVDDGGMSFVQEFTITSANTWQHVSFIVPEILNANINNDEGSGIQIMFPLVCGSTYQTSPGAWTFGYYFASANQQNLLDNTANNVFITGVQIKAGSLITPFDQRSYDEELLRCQRYMVRLPYQSATGDIAYGRAISTSQADCLITLPRPMRPTTPNFTWTNIDITYTGFTNVTAVGYVSNPTPSTLIVRLTGTGTLLDLGEFVAAAPYSGGYLLIANEI